MKKFIVLVSLMFLCVYGLAYGDELLIIGDDSSPPKYYLENGTPKGFIVDIVVWCLQDMKEPYTVKLYPWKRAYQMALGGEGAIIGLSINSERLKIFDYSEPLYYDDLIVVVKKGKEFPFQSIPDLKGKIIGVSRGTSYGDVFDQAVADKIFTIYEVTQQVQAVKMVAADRLDAILIGPGKFGLQKVIATQDQVRMDEFSILPVPFKRDTKHLGILKSLKMQDFLTRFNAALKKGQEAGAFDKMIERYSRINYSPFHLTSY